MPKFVFRSTQTIGSPSAEQDKEYLENCFVETGLLSILRNCNDCRHIIVGRTGAGKSALITRLIQDEPHVIQIKPTDLALQYISNSTIIKYFYEIGVDLNLFYRLLWRHVFCVELLREKYGDIELKKRTFLDRLNPKNKKHELVINYLKKWDDKLWQDTEYGVKEFTSSVEKELQGSLEVSVPDVAKAGITASRKLTAGEKEEVRKIGQDVVNSVQIRDLSALIDFIMEDFSEDKQKRYYIVIDKLDDGWVEDVIRFQLINALIETTSHFAELDTPRKCIKIIVALRTDLLDRVFRFTRGPGFQEEKLKGNSLPVLWNERHLTSILDERVNYLMRDQYTNRVVTHKDLLPQKIGKQLSIEYVLERTLYRPRDIIDFFNTCIQFADGQAVITPSTIKEAEGVYSRDRLRALADEWYGTYPNIFHLAQVLRNKPTSFKVGDLDLTELEVSAIELTESGEGKPGLDLDWMEKLYNHQISPEEYRRNLVQIFYRVGIMGLKLNSTSTISWSFYGNTSSISRAEITDETRTHIQKTFHRILGIHSQRGEATR